MLSYSIIIIPNNFNLSIHFFAFNQKNYMFFIFGYKPLFIIHFIYGRSMILCDDFEHRNPGFHRKNSLFYPL